MNRKRSHDDLEDADECLPISKRINSLHLEGKTQGICHSQHHHINGFPANNDNNPVIISSHPLPGGSSLSFPHQLQQSNTPLAHHQNLVASKSQSVATDYNYNIASSSNMTIPSSYSNSQSHHHIPAQNIYPGTSQTSISTGPPGLLNVNCGAHHSNSVLHSYSHNSHHSPHHTHHQHLHDNDQQQSHQRMPSFYPSQSNSPFINHNHQQIPLSSPIDVSLVNGHYPNAATDISPIGGGAVATNLVLGQSPVLEEDLPRGPYDPELGMTENPHYYDTNKLLYEAHLSRLQRVVPDYQLHS